MGKPVTVSSKELKAFLDASKRNSRLMGHIERHLLAKPFDERDQTHLHPSDIIKPEWCLLASYHALRGNYVETRDKTPLRLASVFEEGHFIHAKWQAWIREMGYLHGTWQCQGCKHRFMGTSPETCPECKATQYIDYREVPLSSPKHMISGHADGWVKGLGEDFAIEIKSIGTGTLRWEAPGILAQADGDLEKAWRNIRQPFRTHQLQGQVYLHLMHLMVEEGKLESAPEEIVFIYELKANQDYKEFTVKYNPEFTADIFEKALDLVWAVDNNRPPLCNIDSVKGCKRCAPFQEEK